MKDLIIEIYSYLQLEDTIKNYFKEDED